ncbi:ribosomal protein S5-alanine N-acetyltransferase [Pseudomonas salomonii]|uniref:[Ribosomal protein uS5]-alanine N-acetyltransferase n=1 Tax=Pseudomonas salomonii TaxID=191391 RepID=A0A7Y8GFV9_9PSED|nr:ribosomal protein S5-alanine N-acetyltransferase [Pseudomonas sp. 58 R 3]NWF09273.1 ribosomal protein S5-alanine N-acetyltransferase [Pseudomonas salomonii]CRM41574.1 Ribosomal-protein-serine acetyltransferase [Pseudomonas sp. 58 R 3]
MNPLFPTNGITTDRLTLHAAHPRHALALQAHLVQNRAYLQPWEPARDDGFFELSAITQRLEVMAEKTANGEALHLLILRDRRIIGSCNFNNIVRGAFEACHLGYALDETAQGQGLMRQALSAAIDYVFAEMKLHRIMANYRPENQRSARLLERLGFEREGYARAYLKINGAWADHVLTSLINPVNGDA